MNAASGSRSDTAGSTSSDLIRRAQSRDPEAWQRLAKLYGPMVHSLDVWARSEVTGGNEARRQLEQIPDLSSDPPPPDDEASESHLRDQAREMVRAQFEDRTWQAFWRVGARGDKPADVAEDLGMSVGAVYMAKSRVLRSVREMFDELF